MSEADETGAPGPNDPNSAARATGVSLGRAPRAKTAIERTATELAEQLSSRFREQVSRALEVDLDGSETSLAFVDHYLSLARSEDRAPILTLLAAGAGAYYGQIVADHLGATWIGDGKDPRKLRLLLVHQFVHFSPVDQALEAIVGESLAPDDARVPTDPPFDASFKLTPASDDPDDLDASEPGAQLRADAAWLTDRLSELPDVPEDEFVSLTCRIETLRVMLEMLSAKHASEGRTPVERGIEAYLSAFAN